VSETNRVDYATMLARHALIHPILDAIYDLKTKQYIDSYGTVELVRFIVTTGPDLEELFPPGVHSWGVPTYQVRDDTLAPGQWRVQGLIEARREGPATAPQTL
jgi:hypothetical protein